MSISNSGSNSGRYEQLMQDFQTEFRPQREWSEGRGFYLIVGHFLVGVAAGAWLFGLYYQDLVSLVAGFILAGLGGLAHLANLARPERFILMMLRTATSWVSRGFWGLTLFLVGSLIYLPPQLFGEIFWPKESFITDTGMALSVAGSIIMMAYMGFVYTASKAIPFWNSTLHPVLYISYAFRGGAAAYLLSLAVRGEAVGSGADILIIWVTVTAIVIALWLFEIQGALASDEEAARRSVHDILAGRLAVYFYVGILLIGLVVPVFLIAGIIAPLSPALMALIGISSVAGDFFMKFSSIKAGIFMPVRLHGGNKGGNKRKSARLKQLRR
jgi:formate-dependent nitrite reductase membrane component NrfD